MQPNDSRRGYRALLNSARLTEARCKLYMGHALDVSQRYGTPERLPAVAEDRGALVAVLDAGEKAARRSRKDHLRTG